MSKVSVDRFAKEIQRTLEEFMDVTEEDVQTAIEQTGSEAVNELQAAAPPGSGKYQSWAQYNRGWGKTKEFKKRGKSTVIVHNRRRYQLTHLLEKGHALKGGGRARAFPHIAPVAEKMEKVLFDNIKKAIR